MVSAYNTSHKAAGEALTLSNPAFTLMCLFISNFLPSWEYTYGYYFCIIMMSRKSSKIFIYNMYNNVLSYICIYKLLVFESYVLQNKIYEYQKKFIENYYCLEIIPDIFLGTIGFLLRTIETLLII